MSAAHHVDPAADELPESVELNAWTGTHGADGALHDQADRWGSRRNVLDPQKVLLQQPPKPEDWSDEDVGYGVVVPDSDAPAAEKAAGADLEQPVRDLLASRPGSVLLRTRDDPRFLTRYFPDGTSQPPKVGVTPFGVGKGQLPRYLAFIGGPEAIPWEHQYIANLRHVVGRIPLSGEALGNYVVALIDGWSGDDVDVRGPVVWQVVHGASDITRLMATTFATPLAEELDSPLLPNLQVLSGGSARAADLLRAVGTGRPALIVTSSHGKTGPLDDPNLMASSLGIPVDVEHSVVDLDAFVAAVPAGAIWYTQACCSAGGGGGSRYDGLLREGSNAERIVSAVGRIPATIAPAALALLSRPNPVRAVIGQIEPTFSWTLKVAETGQGLGGHLVSALAGEAHSGRPIGLGFEQYYGGIGQIYTEYADAVAANNPALRNRLTRLRLTAIDRQSLVLLGDPTVALTNVYV